MFENNKTGRYFFLYTGKTWSLHENCMRNVAIIMFRSRSVFMHYINGERWWCDWNQRFSRIKWRNFFWNRSSNNNVNFNATFIRSISWTKQEKKIRALETKINGWIKELPLNLANCVSLWVVVVNCWLIEEMNVNRFFVFGVFLVFSYVTLKGIK